MTVDLQPDDIDFTTGEFPSLCEKVFSEQQGARKEYGVCFGNRHHKVTLWFRTEGERQMMLQTAELLVQR